MTRPEPGDAPGAGTLRRAFQRVDGHGLFPVGPVLVLQGHSDGTPQGVAVTHAGDDLGAVLLNEHTAASSVTLLTAAQMNADVVFTDGQSGGDALDNYYQALSVGLACCEKSDHGNPV